MENVRTIPDKLLVIVSIFFAPGVAMVFMRAMAPTSIANREPIAAIEGPNASSSIVDIKYKDPASIATAPAILSKALAFSWF